MFLELPNIKLNNIILTNLKNNVSVLSNAIKNIEETSNAKVGVFNHTNTLAVERHKRFLNECEELNIKIGRFKDDVEKLYNSIENKFSYGALEEGICSELEKESEENKNKYNRLRNEYIGKITIQEKEIAITLKEEEDKLVDEMKSIKQKYFDLERKAIIEIEGIEEELLYPVEVKDPLIIEDLLQGNERTRDFRQEEAKNIRLSGIERILEKKENTLCAKKAYLVDFHEYEENGKIRKLSLKAQSDIKTIELTQTLNTIKKEYEEENIRIEFAKTEKKIVCDEDVALKKHEAILQLFEKHHNYHEKILKGNQRYKSDRVSLAEYVKKNDLDILDLIMAFLDRCYYEVSSLIGNVPEGTELIVFDGISKVRNVINEYIKENLVVLSNLYIASHVDFSFMSASVYDGFSKDIQNVCSSFLMKREKAEKKQQNHFKKLAKKMKQDPSKLTDYMKEYLECEASINSLYKEKISIIINKYYEAAVLEAEKEGISYFLPLEAEEQKYIQELENKKNSSQKELDSRRSEIQNEYAQAKHAYDSAIEKKENACANKNNKLSEKIRRINDHLAKDINDSKNKMITLNKKLEDETLAKIRMAMNEASRRKKRLE